MRGGARPGAGQPAADGGRNMQRFGAEWRKIERREPEGREAPDWPRALGVPAQDEYELWEDLWTRQAVAAIWEEEESHEVVAQYVKTMILYMNGRHSAQQGTLAKQLREELLLSAAARRMHKIVIVGTEEADMLDSVTGAKAKQYDEEADAAASGGSKFMDRLKSA